MLRIEELTNRTLATTRRGDGYEVAEVDRFRADVAEAITMRDSLISNLHVELDARPQPGDANPDRADAEACRRESSLAAARLLEMATVNADQLVSDSRAEASP